MQQKQFSFDLWPISVNLSQREREREREELVCDIRVGKSTNYHQSHAFCQVTLSLSQGPNLMECPAWHSFPLPQSRLLKPSSPLFRHVPGRTVIVRPYVLMGENIT